MSKATDYILPFNHTSPTTMIVESRKSFWSFLTQWWNLAVFITINIINIFATISAGAVSSEGKEFSYSHAKKPPHPNRTSDISSQQEIPKKESTPAKLSPVTTTTAASTIVTSPALLPSDAFLLARAPQSRGSLVLQVQAAPTTPQGRFTPLADVKWNLNHLHGSRSLTVSKNESVKSSSQPSAMTSKIMSENGNVLAHGLEYTIHLKSSVFKIVPSNGCSYSIYEVSSGNLVGTWEVSESLPSDRRRSSDSSTIPKEPSSNHILRRSSSPDSSKVSHSSGSKRTKIMSFYPAGSQNSTGAIYNDRLVTMTNNGKDFMTGSDSKVMINELILFSAVWIVSYVPTILVSCSNGSSVNGKSMDTSLHRCATWSSLALKENQKLNPTSSNSSVTGGKTKPLPAFKRRVSSTLNKSILVDVARRTFNHRSKTEKNFSS